MPFRVIIADSAERDMDDIHAYIAQNTSVVAADRVLNEFIARIPSLETMPRRGNIPKELAATGRNDYRELHFKPYRMFYRIVGSQVHVTAVVDGRRDMKTLMRLRLRR